MVCFSERANRKCEIRIVLNAKSPERIGKVYGSIEHLGDLSVTLYCESLNDLKRLNGGDMYNYLRDYVLQNEHEEDFGLRQWVENKDTDNGMSDGEAFGNFVTICRHEFIDSSVELTEKIEFPPMEAQIEHSLFVEGDGTTILPERRMVVGEGRTLYL